MSLSEDFYPLSDKLLVRLLPEAASKILWTPLKHVGPFAMQQLNKGVILRVGPGRKTKRGRLPMAVKAGDVVSFGPYVDAHESGDELAVISQQDVICKIEESVA